MNEYSASKKWLMRGVYLLLCLFIIFLQILPLSAGPSGIAGPDLIFALTYAWTMRRPDFVPIALVAFVFIVTDFIFDRPPGLWSLLVVLCIVGKKLQTIDPREVNFISDYTGFAVTLVVLGFIYRLTLTLFFVDREPLLLSLTQIITTLLAYPIVVAISYYVFRVRPLRRRDAFLQRGLI